MEDQIISLETAKLAKEKGFPIIEKGFYIEGVFTNRGFSKDFHRWYKDDPLIQSAPTQSLLQKWLREEHNLWVEITIWGDGIGTQCLIKKADPQDIENDNSRIVHMVKPVEVGIYVRLEFNYEKTIEKGLQEALKLIK